MPSPEALHVNIGSMCQLDRDKQSGGKEGQRELEGGPEKKLTSSLVFLCFKEGIPQCWELQTTVRGRYCMIHSYS